MDATKHCRENGSLFDVSHMCGLTLKVRCIPPSITPPQPGKCVVHVPAAFLSYEVPYLEGLVLMI